MKRNKVKLTIGMILIGMMSAAILTASYLAVFKPNWVNAQAQQTNQQATADGGNVYAEGNNKGTRKTVSSKTDGLPVFDAKTLAAYDGKNGQPAYIAFEGTVYEVGQLANWVGGFHHGYRAGRDLTDAFANSPHTKAIFKRAIIVGTYSDKPLDELPAVTTDNSSGATTANNTESTTVLENNTLQDNSKTTDNGLPVMTLEELSQYNGKNGQPAYVAVNGVIYDVTDYWRNGKHNGLTAGADVTRAFAGSPHSQSLLNSLTIVGSLALDQQTIDSAIITKTGNNGDENDEYEDGDDDYEDNDNDYEYDDGDND